MNYTQRVQWAYRCVRTQPIALTFLITVHRIEPETLAIAFEELGEHLELVGAGERNRARVRPRHGPGPAARHETGARVQQRQVTEIARQADEVGYTERVHFQRFVQRRIEIDDAPQPGVLARVIPEALLVRALGARRLGGFRRIVAEVGDLRPGLETGRTDACPREVRRKLRRLHVVEARGRARVEAEARLYEGLQSVYTGNLISARSRSRELVVRIGRPFRQ